LKVAGSATFTQLRQSLHLTDGTLSVHLTKLAEGGMITVTKQFVGKRPQTLVRLTPAGRRRFQRYVKELKEIVPGLA
jgi:DNA-binding MarR family transcriptional regulator